MPADKVPGTEGFPPEFIRKFYPELKSLVFQVVVDAAKNGFSISVRMGIISLMEKEHRDLLQLKNWRPLSLLNTEYKLLSKILSNRIKKVLPTIIHVDQSGFQKGKSLTDNIIDLIMALEICDREQIPILLISFDFEKAFDRVEWSVLFHIMKHFGFCEEYIDMIQSMFKGIESCTVNCGYASEYISISRSLRQGCPISANLFLLIVEVLGQKIRQNVELQGIFINNVHKKHAQYVDDLWTLIKATQKNLDTLMQIMDNFNDATGFKINYDKTQVL